MSTKGNEIVPRQKSAYNVAAKGRSHNFKQGGDLEPTQKRKRANDDYSDNSDDATYDPENNDKYKTVDKSEEDYEDEEYEESEDEENGGEESPDDDNIGYKRSGHHSGKRAGIKRRAASLNPFLDIEAEVDDNEEDEEEEGALDDPEFIASDGEVSETGGYADYRDADAVISQHDEPGVVRKSRAHGRGVWFNEDENAKPKDIAADLEKRYGRASRVPRAMPTHFSHIDEPTKHSLTPNANDPKLWFVRCKEGKERSIVHTLMKRMMNYMIHERLHGSENQTGADAIGFRGRGVAPPKRRLLIYSAFSRDDLRGGIYVEAMSRSHVMDALARAPGISMYSQSFVPLKEMPDVLSVDKSISPSAKETQEWARMRRGRYAGDLVHILEVSPNGADCLVSLVPRLEYPNLVTGEIPKRNDKKRFRPPQRKFNPKEFPASSVTCRGRNYMYNRERFKDGLLIKTVKMSLLDFNAAPPSPDEINMFFGDSEKHDLKLQAGLQTAIEQHKVDLCLGDMVDITSGELAGVPAVVLAINNQMATVRTKNDGMFLAAEFPLSQLRRRFEIGAKVAVLYGPHKGKSGAIVHIFKDNPSKLIVTSTDHSELEVNIWEICTVSSLAALSANSNFRDATRSTGSNDLGSTNNSFSAQGGNGSRGGPAGNATNNRFNSRQGPRPRGTGIPRRDTIVGQPVVILAGPYKGYLGIIKTEAADIVQVELHTNARVVEVERARISFQTLGGSTSSAHMSNIPDTTGGTTNSSWGSSNFADNQDNFGNGAGWGAPEPQSNQATGASWGTENMQKDNSTSGYAGGAWQAPAAESVPGASWGTAQTDNSASWGPAATNANNSGQTISDQAGAPYWN